MECGDIRQRLSAYLDGIASSEEKKAIEDHLPSCQACSAAFRDLRRTGELVRGLEEVEPPPWMTQKVLARIRREQDARKSLFEKLFFPLRIKIPIQAMATVLIAVLAIYVFKAGEPEMKKAQSPVRTDEVTSKAEMPKHPPAPAAEVPAPQTKGLPKEMPKSSGNEEIGSALEEKGQAVRAPSARETMKGAPEAESRAGDKRREGPSVTALSRPAPTVPSTEAPGGRGMREGVVSKPDETVISFGSGEMEAAKQKRMPAAGAVKTEEYPPAKDSLSGELKAPAAAAAPRSMVAKRAGAIGITVQVRDVEVAGGEIEALLHQLGATRVEKELTQDAEIITAELQPEKFGELIEKLKLKGEIKEKELPLQLSQGEAKIRVEILTAR